MITRICARLWWVVGLAGLAQVQVWGQAMLERTQPQFGTEPAPYAQPAVPAAPRALPAYPQPGGPEASGAGFATQPSAPPSADMMDVDPSKPLGRGDTVTFSIAQDREQPQIMRVTDTGELDFSEFPKIGRVSVVGRTCAQVAAELKKRLEADYYNAADVRLGINQVNRATSLGKIYVTGNVRAPGPYDILPGDRMTVSTAVIRAGGFDKFANERKVQVTHKNKDGSIGRFAVDVKSIIDNGRIEKDVELHDGDYVNVPQRVVNF